jgi:hypothetical protein
MERQRPGKGKRLRLLAKKIHRHTKRKKIEKDGCKRFSKLHPTDANYGWGKLCPPHACKLLQDYDDEECKWLSAKYDVCLLDLAALGVPQR